MRRPKSLHRSCFRRRLPGDDRALSTLIFVTSLTAALIVLSLALPRPVVLPAFSLCAITAAGVALVAAVRLRANASRSGAALDLAGAFTIVGAAATIFGEIEPVIEYIQPTAFRSRAHD